MLSWCVSLFHQTLYPAQLFKIQTIPLCVFDALVSDEHHYVFVSLCSCCGDRFQTHRLIVCLCVVCVSTCLCVCVCDMRVELEPMSWRRGKGLCGWHESGGRELSPDATAGRAVREGEVSGTPSELQLCLISRLHCSIIFVHIAPSNTCISTLHLCLTENALDSLYDTESATFLSPLSMHITGN